MILQIIISAFDTYNLKKSSKGTPGLELQYLHSTKAEVKVTSFEKLKLLSEKLHICNQKRRQMTS
jgi:hypothetical protein